MTIEIKKAVRQRVWLKLGITGPSGSGKTYGSIALGKGLAPTGKVCVIDTENESASLYAEKWDYDVITMHAPFTTLKYSEALDAVIMAGYEVVIIDSLTHEWAASGGILDQKTTKDARGGNSFQNWGEMKQLHNRFVERLLQSPIHVISTLRSKMEHVMEQDEKGKTTVRKVGLAPISSEGMEYEFSVLFDVDRNTHLASASKDRTGLFEGRSLSLDESVGRELRAWLDGASVTKITAPAPPPKVNAREKVPAVAMIPEPQKTMDTAGVAPAPPAEWVDAMAELAEVTLAITPKTRTALIAEWEKSGPTELPALRAEISGMRAMMVPRAPEPTKAEVGQVLVEMQTDALGRKPEISQEAADFVDLMDPMEEQAITLEQYQALGALIEVYHVDRAALRAYCARAGHLLPGAHGPTLARMKPDAFLKLRSKLLDTKKASPTETWSQRTVAVINSHPTTTFAAGAKS